MREVTDSFCERCGARYTFTPNAPKNLSLKGARVLAKGLRNFVLTDGQSMADAITLARSEDNHESSSRMTEAFHRTFNFCMTCRQYACERCWNAKVGACLTCAPESDLQPVAPEDHLIVRTPVARWDMDWSLFPEGPASEPLARPAPPAPFNEPIRLAEPRKPNPAADPALEMWPAGDLPEDPATRAASGSARKRRSAYQKSVDAQAADLWPIADEIAPEMTLTPEELELVETRLSHPETVEEADAVDIGPVEAAPVEPAEAVEAWPVEASPDSDQEVEPAAAGATRTAPPVPAWVAKNVEPHGQPAAPPPALEWSVAEPMLAVPVEPQAAESRPIAEPALPPLSLPASEPPARPHVPIVARLLGRHDPRPDEDASTRSGRSSEVGPQSAGEPWPHATEWTSRPLEGQGRWAETDATFEEPGPEPGLPDAATPGVVAESDLEQAALGLPAVNADARTAAAVRLEAVASASDSFGPDSQPVSDDEPRFEAAAQQPLFDLSQRDHEPVDPDVLEAARVQSVPTSDRTTARRPGPSATDPQTPAGPPSAPSTQGSWPPLGASWPPQANANAPWPGPEAAPVPAIVAAQQADTPILAELWAESAQEVLNRGSVRVCHHCALPVSTQARYCRRCGTQQA
jgi:hypothetical protein